MLLVSAASLRRSKRAADRAERVVEKRPRHGQSLRRDVIRTAECRKVIRRVLSDLINQKGDPRAI